MGEVRGMKHDITRAVNNGVTCLLVLAAIIVIEFMVRMTTGTLDGWWVLTMDPLK